MANQNKKVIARFYFGYSGCIERKLLFNIIFMYEITNIAVITNIGCTNSIIYTNSII